MLGGPQRLIAGFVHHAGDAARGPEYLGEAVVGVAAVVGGRALEADIVEVDLPDIKHMKAFDHVWFLLFARERYGTVWAISSNGDSAPDLSGAITRADGALGAVGDRV